MQQAGFSKGFTKIKSRAVAADNQDAMESGFAYSRTGNIKGHFSRYEKKNLFWNVGTCMTVLKLTQASCRLIARMVTYLVKAKGIRDHVLLVERAKKREESVF